MCLTMSFCQMPCIRSSIRLVFQENNAHDACDGNGVNKRNSRFIILYLFTKRGCKANKPTRLFILYYNIYLNMSDTPTRNAAMILHFINCVTWRGAAWSARGCGRSCMCQKRLWCYSSVDHMSIWPGKICQNK